MTLGLWLWLGTYLFHSTALGLIAFVLTRRMRDPEIAEAVWKGAALGALLTASAACFLFGGFWSVELMPFLSDAAPSPAFVAAPGAPAIGLAEGLTLAWLAGGTLLVSRDAIARTLFMRRLGTRVPVSGRALVAMTELRRLSGAKRPVTLTASAALTSPVALGRREICLPLGLARQLDSRMLRALLAHELAHLLRHDGAWLRVMGLLEGLLFVQPLNRIARREVQRLAEQACDRRAAELLADPQAVAECLVEVASWSRAEVPLGIVAVLGGGRLAERIERLVRQERMRRPSRTVPPMCAAGMLLVGLSMPVLAAPAQGSHPPATRSAPGNTAFTPDRQSDDFRAGFEAAVRHRQSGTTDARRAALERAAMPRAPSPSGSATRREPRLDPTARAEIERQLRVSR